MFSFSLENLATVRSNDGQTAHKDLGVCSDNWATYFRSDSARSAGNLRRGKAPEMVLANKHGTIERSKSLCSGFNLEPKVMFANQGFGSKSRKIQARP